MRSFSGALDHALDAVLHRPELHVGVRLLLGSRLLELLCVGEAALHEVLPLRDHLAAGCPQELLGEVQEHAGGAELRDDRQDVGKELLGNFDIHALLLPYAKTKINRIAMSRP